MLYSIDFGKDPQSASAKKVENIKVTKEQKTEEELSQLFEAEVAIGLDYNSIAESDNFHHTIQPLLIVVEIEMGQANKGALLYIHHPTKA